MKISKSLLQAIALGVALGTVSTSCNKDTYEVLPAVEENSGVTDEPVDEANNNHTQRTKTGESQTCWDCPACGLG